MKCLIRSSCPLLMAVLFYPILISAEPAIITVQQVLLFDYVGGMRFTFKLNQDVLERTIWQSDMQSAPLAPRTAAAIATKQLAKMVPHPDDYEVITIALKKVDHTDWWYYEVDFLDSKYTSESKGDQKCPIIQVPVLLDGSVIVPRVDKAAPYDTSGIAP